MKAPRSRLKLEEKEIYTYRSKFVQKSHEEPVTEDFTNIDEYLDSLSNPKKEKGEAKGNSKP